MKCSLYFSLEAFVATLPPQKVSAPGEIKEEYEDALRKIQEEEERRRKEEENASEIVITQLQVSCYKLLNWDFVLGKML